MLESKKELTQKTDNDEKYPFFIVSAGRSGSTLLCALLNANKGVFIPPESDFIARAYPFYGHRNNFSESDYYHLSNLFIKTSQKAWKMDVDFLSNILIKQRPETFKEVNSVIYNSFLSKNHFENDRWGIKRPVLIASIDILRKVFPNAKVIHIVRDGRDVFLSYNSAHKMGQKFGPKNLLTCALYWVDALRRINVSPNDFIIEIRYEDLILNTNNTMREICNFINVEYDNDCINKYIDSPKNLILISNEHKNTIHKKINDGISKNNIFKYKSKIGIFEKAIFELLAGEYLHKYNYGLDFPIFMNPIFKIFRSPLYFSARIFNNIRYSFRDLITQTHAKYF